MIGRALVWMGARGAPILAVGVMAGLLWPALAAALRPVLVPSVFAIAVHAFLRLDVSAVTDYGRRPLLGAAVLIWLLGLCPLAMWLAVAAAGLPAALSTALVLAAMSPPVIASVALALLLGLDASLAVVVSVLAMLLAPLTLPPLALALLGLEIDIGLGDLMLRLALFVGGAGLIAGILRRLAPPGWIAAHAGRIDGWNVIFFLLFAVAVMDGLTEALLARPGFVLLYVAAAFAANLALQALGGALFWRLGRRQALTVGLLSGNRNLALLIAVLVGGADFDVMVYFAIGQLPIFILPALLAPVYRRLAPAPGKRP